MSKRTLLLAFFSVLVSVLAVSAATYAYRGNPAETGPAYNPDRHEAMTKALENKDYEAWAALMGGRGVAQKINKDNFARFAESWQLTKAGKTDEANKIRQELGLGVGATAGGMMKGKKSGGCGCSGNQSACASGGSCGCGAGVACQK